MVDRMGGMEVWVYSADEYHPECCVKMMVDHGELSPGALGMPTSDVLRQYVESNGETYENRDWDSDAYPCEVYYWGYDLLDNEGGPRSCGYCHGLLDDGYECEMCGAHHSEQAHGEALESRDHGQRSPENMLVNQIATMYSYLLEFHLQGVTEIMTDVNKAYFLYVDALKEDGVVDDEGDFFEFLLGVEEDLERMLWDWTDYMTYNNSDAGMWGIWVQSDRDDSAEGVAARLGQALKMHGESPVREGE